MVRPKLVGFEPVEEGTASLRSSSRQPQAFGFAAREPALVDQGTFKAPVSGQARSPVPPGPPPLSPPGAGATSTSAKPAAAARRSPSINLPGNNIPAAGNLVNRSARCKGFCDDRPLLLRGPAPAPLRARQHLNSSSAPVQATVLAPVPNRDGSASRAQGGP